MDDQKGRTKTQIAIDYMNLYKNSGALSSEMTKDAIEILIEQAGYVPDLEEALKISRLNAEYQHDRKHINMDRVIELEKENKRLREALKEIAKGINDYYEQDNAQIALGALEGVSNGQTIKT